MADGVEYTENDYLVAYNGLIFQAKAHECYGAILLNDNLEDFIMAIAKVIASERAYSRMLQNALHEDLHRGEKS